MNPRWHVRLGSRTFVVYAASEAEALARVREAFPESSRPERAELMPIKLDPYSIEYGPGWFRRSAA